jgi:hypothetical protein
MISARITGSAQMAAHLAAQARKLALARSETRRRGAGRWRVASLLWPLFAGER